MILPRKTALLAAFLALVPSLSHLQAVNPPAVLKTFNNVNVPKSGATATVALGGHFGLAGLIGGTQPGTPGPIARFSLITGLIDIEMFPEVTPATVANFRKYLGDKDYDATFIHRAVPGFVIQGGGYKVASSSTHIPTDPPVKNEFQRSNTVGTIAMAKIAGNLNSATSEWFFNVVSNPGLDVAGQQFAVFGRIIGNGLTSAIGITQLPILNLGGALTQCPVINWSGGPVYTSNLVALNTLREIPFIPSSGTRGGYLILSASSSNPSLITTSVSGGNLTLKSVGSGTGFATITVRAADSYGQSVATSFVANVVNPALPVVTITAPDSSTAEPGTNTATFRLTRTGSTSAALTVNILGTGGTAIHGNDFNTLPATVVIPAGATYKDTILTPKNDTLKEGTEKAKVTVAAGSTYVSAPLNNALIPISDDDVPTVTLAITDANATEGTTDTAKVRFTRTGATTSALSAGYLLSGPAVSGLDYLVSNYPMVIPAGATFAELTITPKDDTLKEGVEGIVITPVPTTSCNISNNPITVNLFDNDVPTVTQTISDAIATEPASDTAKVKITRTGATTWPLTIYLSTGGTAGKGVDYLTPPLAVTIPAGQTYTYFTITPKDDTVDEVDETVIVTLNPSAYLNATPGSTTLTLRDND